MSKKGHNTKKILITESDNKTKNTLLMNCWNWEKKRIVLSLQKLLRKIKTINQNNLSFMV